MESEGFEPGLVVPDVPAADAAVPGLSSTPAEALFEAQAASDVEVVVEVIEPEAEPVSVVPTIPEPAPLTSHGPARVIAMVNQKGGVGKTTSTVSLGAALAGYGRKVLLVDFDPQGALSVALGVNALELDLTVYDLLTRSDCHVGDVVLSTDVVNLDLLPSNIDLSAAEVQLVNEVGREHALARALAPVLPEYDIVLIDCQPSLGLLTLNGLAASDDVIIPMQAEYFALRGVALLTDTIDKVVSRVNPNVKILGVLATMYDPRTLHSREVLHTVRQAFGEKVFQTVITKTVKFPDSAVAGEPITSFAPGSPGAEAYRQLAREVVARMG